MALEIVGRQMGRGNDVDRIVGLCWRSEEDDRTSKSSLGNLVSYVQKYGDQALLVRARNGRRINIAVYQLDGVNYLRTYADGDWTDNLLALPLC
jgi:hypothetical protein